MSSLEEWRAEREYRLAARAARERGDYREAARIVLARDEHTRALDLEKEAVELTERNRQLVRRLREYEKVEEESHGRSSTEAPAAT
ncbi:MAG: hypothetical protein ACJ757_04855 [Gaiellaceae bacterium]